MKVQLRGLGSVVVVVAAALMASVPGTMAKAKVHVDADKAFDFKSVRTWAWNPEGPGDVKMARTPDDNPDTMKKLAEPIILDAVPTEMARRGLKLETGSPDLRLTYYLLLTVGTSAQLVGQFLPSTTNWGIPPFTASTQSLTVMNQGSLVFDLSAKNNVVWRGVAQAQIPLDADNTKREKLLREGVREILEKFPPKK